MSYIDKNLMNGENVLYRAKLHWVVFLFPVPWLIIALMIIIGSSEASIIASCFVLIAIFWGIVSYIEYTTSEFGITNKRVIVKIGLIRRISIELLLNKIEGIHVIQGIWGRILGFGSITVSGTGGSKDPFHRIGAPLEFRKRIQEQIDIIQDS